MISGSNVFSWYVNLLGMHLVTKIVFVGLNVSGSITSKYMHLLNSAHWILIFQGHLTKMFNTCCGVQKFSKIITPCVIPKAEEANTIPRSPYTQMVRSERWVMATSMAYYRKGPHCRGRASGRELALIWIKGW